MKINEAKVEAAYEAWDRARKSGQHRVVFGVAHESSGDVVFSWGPGGQLERVVACGLGLAKPRRGDDDLVARAMSQDRFSVVAPRNYDMSRLLRVWPPIGEGNSRKSAHPAIGGLGTVSSTVLTT